MKSFTISVPDSFDLDSNHFLMMLASQLYEQGKLPLGQAADLAGLSERIFAELLSKQNVSLFNFSANDILADIANA